MRRRMRRTFPSALAYFQAVEQGFPVRSGDGQRADISYGAVKMGAKAIWGPNS